MAVEQVQVLVFAHTNLDTRIAFNTPLDITVSAFKRDFERVHFTCLPNIGEIQVNGLMVKRKSCFYYLPDSLPLKYAFPGMTRTWFLHVEVRHLKNSRTSPRVVEKCLEHRDLKTCNNEEKKMEGFQSPAYLYEEHGTTNRLILTKQTTENENYMQNAANKSQHVMHPPENICENVPELSAKSMQVSPSEAISVTGIINKYFTASNGVDSFHSPSISEVTSKVDNNSEIEVQSKAKSHSFSKKQTHSLPKFCFETPPRVLHAPLDVNLVSDNSRDKIGRSKVGKRLLLASRSLGASASKNSPTLSFVRYKDGKVLEYKSQIKGSIFSISDSDG
ncbi:hypothetical protein Lalb_Chr18g0052131 [Lupinus albus]|uniref:Uncharacterized protein n=1 Tax=Lupinus albus TaxID=3870 RepID=A0A6A4NY49_LUPAL|nr:hypothetical protein Lalb_Chr18g0052131 [Lupinus albus]